MNKKKEMCQNHFKKLMLRLSKLAILNLKARMLQMGAMHDKTNRQKYRQSRKQAENDLEEAKTKIRNYLQDAKKMTNREDNFIDVNKANMLEYMISQFYAQLEVGIKLKTQDLDEKRLKR